jgi:hypothetical protein
VQSSIAAAVFKAVGGRRARGRSPGKGQNAIPPAPEIDRNEFPVVASR